MKVILFVGQSTKHFSYYESSLIELKNQDYDIVFRYDKKFSNSIIYPAFNNFIKSHGSSFKWIKKSCKCFQYIRFFIRELTTYAWYLRRSDQSKYYVDRWAELFPFPVSIILKTNLVRFFLSQKFLFNIFVFIERLTPVPFNILKDLREISPDIIYVSPGNMRFSCEIDYVKGAKKIGIPSFVSILSWDNLTNKGYFHAKPDFFLVWNVHHKFELLKLHAVALEKISIVGAQLFDKWFVNHDDLKIDPMLHSLIAQRYILYLGSSSNIAKDESFILKQISSDIKDAGEDFTILFKPHPAHFLKYKDLDINGVKVLPSNFGLSETPQDIVNFRYLVKKSECVVGINTSGFIDAVIIGKECFSYISDEHKQTQTACAHFKILEEYDILPKIKSYYHLLSMKNRERFIKKRAFFINKFVLPEGRDRSAGEIAADKIISLSKI
jgi:hypothetical protein